MHYEVLGEGHGPRVVYLNGSGSTMGDLVPMLGPFIRRFTVAVFDYRGMGRSDVPADQYAMCDLADDTVALVDHLGWDRFSVFGISFGGMVAQHVASGHMAGGRLDDTVPGRIERMVMACTSSGGAGGSSYPLHELGALSEAERAVVMPTIIDTRFTPEFLAGDETARAIVSRPRAVPTGEGVRGAAMQMRARAAHDAWDLLGRIDCPVMVASGSTDGIAPPENGRRLAERLRDATYREFTGGHLFMLQDRSATPAMVEFLAGV